MTVDEFVKVLDSVTKLVAALAWPAVIAFVLIRYGPVVRDFLQSLGEFSVKGAGFEASAKRRQAEAAAALVAAATSTGSTPPQVAAAEAKAAFNTVQTTVTPAALRSAAGALVLWVDDNPDNNKHERASLEALGVSFVLATSTDEALACLQSTRFRAIISDMGRPPDSRAGYTLLGKLRERGDHTPFIIYAGSNAPEHKAEAKSKGALGSTNRASELFEYVIRALLTAA